MVILLVHIVHAGEQTGLGDTAQLKEHPNRQARGGDDSHPGSLRVSHPGRHRQRLAIGEPYYVLDFVVKIVLPDDGQAL